MATLQVNQDQRDSDIIVYYSGLSTYNTQIVADIPFQQNFAHFDDLIILYYDELMAATGYAYSSTAAMPDATGTVGSAPWWTNANTANQNSDLFFINTTIANPDYLYMFNGQVTPNQRSYFSLWNQYSSVLGGYNNFGFQNAVSRSSYTVTQNPLATGSNFLMAEPLEYYGNTADLEWGQIVYDGGYAYSNRYLSDTSYNSHTDTGFNNYERSGISIGNFLSPVSSGSWSSPFEIFRYTWWGSGANNSTGSTTIVSHSATSDTGSFIISGLTQTLSVDVWYSIYDSSDTTKGWVIYITSATYDIIDNYWTYTYSGADWPAPNSGSLNGTWSNVYSNPAIDPSIKTGAASDGRTNIWTAVYNDYYTKFKNALNAITTQANNWLATLTPITSFDYTIIDAIAGSSLGLAATTAFITILQTWINDWTTLIHGGIFNLTDANWSFANLDNLLSSSSGGLNLILNFSTNNYNLATQTGILPIRRTQVYTLLGNYIPGASEFLEPNINQIINNNTGEFNNGSLYFYRFEFMDDRLDRISGTLTQAFSGYTSYNNQLANITTLNANMASQTINNQYDITPAGFVATTNEANQITTTWNATKAASSYNIDRKQGISGTWTRIATAFEYVAPPQPLTAVPPTPNAEYDDPAYTFGFQGFGLTITNPNAFTGLNDDFTVYDFNLAINGGTATDISFRGMDAKTWNAFVTTLNNQFTSSNIGIAASVTTDLILTSNLAGNGSSISITAGITNDLLAALHTTPATAVPGISYLFAGNVYYYRFKVCNGWDSAGPVIPSFPSEVSYTRTDISFSSSDNSINTVSGNFTTAGFVVGQIVSISGSASNNFNGGPIKTVTASKITLSNVRVVNEIAGASDTIIGAEPNYQDWLSQSEYEYTAYTMGTDIFTNGEAGTITWDPPTNLSTTNTVTEVSLNWTADVAAASYNVYRATSLNGGYALIANPTTNSYNDTEGIPGFVYYYKVSSEASSNNKLYDTNGNFLSAPIQSTLTIAGVPGHILWQTITLSASTTDTTQLTLTWSALAGATGYEIYKSMTQTGQYNFLANDDGTPMIVNGTSYVDAQPAQQYFTNSFTSPTDGIAYGVYTPNVRYYFIVICTGLNFQQTAQQYYITAPKSGIWTAQTIANSIQAAINNGLDNANCNLITLANPTPVNYRIKFTTVVTGTKTSISVLDGTFGPSLLPLLGGMASTEAGTGAYTAVPAYYQVSGVQTSLGSIVRQSVLSNSAQGIIPVNI